MSPRTPQIRLDYGLDQWPPPGPLAVLSLQWLMLLVPGLLVLGGVISSAWGLSPEAEVAFLQRLLLLMGVVQAAQVLVGHRLAGMVGPSAVLLVGVLATLGEDPGVVMGSLAAGGALMAAAGALGLAARLGRLYTPPVLATTLLLIAMALAPQMRDLVYDPQTAGREWGAPLIFAGVLVLAMAWAQHRLKGLWGTAVVVLGMTLGTGAYYALGLGPPPAWTPSHAVGLPPLGDHALGFSPAVTAAFCICYLALVSNELGTVEAVGQLVGADGMGRRIDRAVLVGGLGSAAAGLLGVLGPVTYSVSPGVVISSRSASRFTLLPAAAAVTALGLWPGGLAIFALVPPLVVGAVLVMLMAQTVVAALTLLTADGRPPDWATGVVVGVSVVTGLVVSFMPPEARESLHPFLRPLLANGFVVGLGLAFLLEHVFLRRQPRSDPPR